MRIAARLGRHAEALQTYDRLVNLLDEEFQGTPLPETRKLANAIRAEYHAAPEHYISSTSLAGRRSERAELLQLVEQAHAGRGRIVLIEGSPGIGKTRLLEAIAEGAVWREAQVIWGAPTDQAGNIPTSLDQALRSILAALWTGRIPADLPNTTSELLASNQLQYATEYTQALGGTTASTQLPIDATILPELLHALSIVAPHVIILDNMHLADVRLWQAVQTCANLITNHRVLLILSYRSSELRAQTAKWQIACALDRASTVTRNMLNELERDECAELAHTIDATIDDASIRTLYERSGGHPGLLKALLAADTGVSIPQPAQALIEERLIYTNVAARQLLELLSVAGASSTLAVLSRLSHPVVLYQLPRLISERWIAERDGVYHYRQTVVRDYIYGSIDAEQRRSLHQEIGLALEHLELAPNQAAWHYEQAENGLSALRLHKVAAQQYVLAHDYAMAVQCYSRALATAYKFELGAQQIRSLRQDWQAAALQSAQPPRSELPIIHTVQLARTGAPLGRPLQAAELVSVRWTIHAGAADEELARTDGKIALRRSRLMRLVAEATSQGATPTDSDLALALNVTERTIVTDIKALRAAGHVILTRKRKTPQLSV
jgi:biotin operon repressor